MKATLLGMYKSFDDFCGEYTSEGDEDWSAIDDDIGGDNSRSESSCFESDDNDSDDALENVSESEWNKLSLFDVLTADMVKNVVDVIRTRLNLELEDVHLTLQTSLRSVTLKDKYDRMRGTGISASNAHAVLNFVRYGQADIQKNFEKLTTRGTFSNDQMRNGIAN